MKSGSLTEQRLVRQMAEGKASAMNELYDRYAGYLTGVGSRYVSADDDLKDVLQESFIKIFTRIGSFSYRGEGSLKAWMTRIVVNEALTFLRREAASGLVSTEAELPDTPDEEPDVDNLPAEVILRLLRRLPPGYRAVFNLYVMEGRSHREIAQMLNIKPDTSASQFHKAKNLLARMIKEYNNKE
ncbi:RNA polymerase sigma factor [Prevotella sp. kh1p2]|uniref:RNA polymerase sigma factor n=1 Tax=Prevotella sp. kh1p2 TaxID=1761883 RepID=UPI0008C3E97C|nr:RNA polymerase sigma factor [Prevotella sp. kh1p2]SES86974.1 RNA polymerase sigma-70 factor, ECF subfamily [Prevotella sp. kh1p2]SNU11121.1 RNA polymerase sigma-70 factor, ECF subfamily [Prevotellaceae bacterium KH2P17]